LYHELLGKLKPLLTLDSTHVQTAGQTKHSNIFLIPHEQFTAADRNAVILCSSPTRGIDKTVFLFLVYIVLCRGRLWRVDPSRYL